MLSLVAMSVPRRSFFFPRARGESRGAKESGRPRANVLIEYDVVNFFEIYIYIMR